MHVELQSIFSQYSGIVRLTRTNCALCKSRDSLLIAASIVEQKNTSNLHDQKSLAKKKKRKENSKKLMLEFCQRLC